MVMATLDQRARYWENAMSQSIRTPSGIALRAVAAASLFASRTQNESEFKAKAEKPKDEDGAKKLKIRAGLKPQPKR
jgi:hypothetical protein